MTTNRGEPTLDRAEDNPGPEVSTTDQDTDVARQQAIKQIKRRRSFHIELVVSGIGMAILIVIWATTEHHNAGGWPTQGFSQSSGIHGVWNYWIIYPIGAWVLILAGRAWAVYGRRGITEREIEREIERQTAAR
jgi:hypothetical protein